MLQFLREAKQELKKVVWPSRRHTVASTSVVLAFVFLIALFLGFVDFIVSKIVRAIIS